MGFAVLLASILTILSITRYATGDYVGCYYENPNNRFFSVTPGGYSPTTVTPTICRIQCANWNYAYAGLTSGAFCFCASTLPSSSQLTPGGCTVPCPGGGGTCGSTYYVDAYTTPLPITGTFITATASNPVIGSTVSFSVGYLTGPAPNPFGSTAGVRFSLNFGDGAGWTLASSTTTYSFIYNTPGEYLINVIASDVENLAQAKMASVYVKISSPVTASQMYCPPTGVSSVQVPCNATVWGGTNMHVTASYADGNSDNYPLADTQWVTAGPGIPHSNVMVASSNPASGSATSTIYIMPNSQFLASGDLQFFDYYSWSAGTVTLLVLKPNCANYCFDTNTCGGTPGICGSGQVLCGVSGACVSGSSCGTPYNRYSAGIIQYTVVQAYTSVSILTGWNTYTVPTSVTVAPGYIIGYQSGSSSGLFATRPPISGETSDVVATGATTVGTTLTNGATAGFRHMLRAVANNPSTTIFFHTYSTGGTYNITVKATNDYLPNWSLAWSQIIIGSGINDSTITGPTVVKTLTSATFNLLPQSGMGIQWNWDFGDGTKTSPSSLPVTHSWSTKGFYTIKVYSYNVMNSQNGTLLVWVQDAITSVNVAGGPSATGVVQNFTFTVATGSDYVCHWNMGDGTAGATFTTNSTTTPSGSKVPYKYTTAGTYTMTVSCSNNISGPIVFTASNVVQDPITNLHFVATSAITNTPFVIQFAMSSGSSVTCDILTWNGVSLTGFTYNSMTFTGQSASQNIATAGRYPVHVHCYNLVSTSVADANFTIEAQIGTVSCSATPLTTSVGTAVTFTVTISSGSSVKIDWNYGDSTPDDVYAQSLLQNWPAGSSQSKTHSYTAAGTYNVVINVTNSVTFKQCFQTVTVTANLNLFSLNTNAPVAFVNSEADFSAWFTSTAPLTPGLTVSFDYGDGVVTPAMSLALSQQYTHTYKSMGTYTVKASLNSGFTTQVFTATVSCVEPVANVYALVSPPAASVGSPVTFSLGMYTGANVTLYVNYGDSGTTTVLTRKGATAYDLDAVSHTFTTPGTYSVTIVASNSLGNTSMTYKIVVQSPVTNSFTLSSNAPSTLPPGLVTATLSYPTGQTLPTGAYVAFNWGDGSAVVNQSLPFVQSTPPFIFVQSHVYTKTGDYVITATITNMASSVTLKTSGGVFGPIVGLKCTPYYRTPIPIGGPLIAGTGSSKNTFARQLPVLFEMSTMSGVVVSYNVNAVSLSNTQSVSSTTAETPVTFTQTGSYAVTVTAKNGLATATASCNVILADSVTGVSVSDGGVITKPGVAKSVTISFSTLGVSTCVSVNYGDGSSLSYYGNDATSCKTLFGVQPSASLTNPLTVTHKYATAGFYTLAVNALDPILSATGSLTFPVSADPCSPPSITITNATPLFNAATQEMCEDMIIVEANVNLMCSLTIVNGKQWTIEKVSASDGSTISKVDTSSLTTTTNKLALSPRFLPYGKYKFSINVTMVNNGVNTVFTNVAYTFVDVVESPLIAQLVAGGMSYISVGPGQTFTVDPGTYSLDPDVDPTQSQGITGFAYYCHDINEALPLNPDGSLSSLPGGIPLTAAQLAARITDLGGCFWQGPGGVGVTTSSLTFNTNNMHVGHTYEFVVIITKGDRTAQAKLQLEVKSIAQTTTSIQCLSSLCMPSSDGSMLVNPSARLALAASCPSASGCSASLNYLWIITRKGLNGAWLSIPNYAQYITGLNGINSAQISISPTLYTDGYKLYANLVNYRIELQTWLTGGATSSSQTYITLNAAPSGGACSLSPLTGTAGVTTWTVQCSGWTDTSGISNYQFYAVFQNDDVNKQLGFDGDGTMDVSLPLGPSYNNYKMDVYVRITDKALAFTDYFIATAQSNPASTQQVNTMMASFSPPATTLTSNPASASVTPVLTNNVVAKVAAEGNMATANTQYMSVNSILTQSVQNDVAAYPCINTTVNFTNTMYTTNNVQLTSSSSKVACTAAEIAKEQAAYDASRDQRAQLRTMMAESLCSMTKWDVNSIQQCSSALALLTSVPDEITRSTQLAVSKTVQNMASRLASLSSSMPKEAVTFALNSLVATWSNTLKASNLVCDDSTQSDIKSAMLTKDYDYDTYILSNREGFRNLKTKDAQKTAFRKETNCVVQKEAMTTVSANSVNALKSIEQAAANSLIPGEPSISITTPLATMNVTKSTGGNIAGKTYVQGGASVTLPDWCSMTKTTTTTCAPSTVCTMAIATTPFNTYGNVASQGQVNSMSSTVSVNFFDASGKSISMPSMSKPCSLQIPRDPQQVVPAATPITNAVIPDRDSSYLFYHSFNISDNDQSIHIRIVPSDPKVQIHAYVRFGGFPDLPNKTWDFFQPSPLNLAAVTAGKTSTIDPYTVFLTNTQVKSFKGKVVVGLRQAATADIDKYTSANPPPVPAPNTATIGSYDIFTYSSSCQFFDEKKNQWSAAGCTVGVETTPKCTTCYCTHFTTFGSGWVVEPNQIDFQFVFSHADFYQNSTIYITVIIIFSFYIIGMIWSYHMDRWELSKLGVTPLPDNHPHDKYFYEIVVKTGLRRGAATESKVHFVVSGDQDETDIRLFDDPQRKIFQRAATNCFLMATPRPLGSLNFVRLFHDNSGKGSYASWYCKFVAIYDLQTKEKFIFMVDRWFAVEEDDGQVDRLIPVAGPEQMTQFTHMFTSRTRQQLSDEHLWFSIVARPTQSVFSRMERLSCCLCLLFTSMIANMLFYQRTDDSASTGLDIGPFTLSPEQVYVGVIANLIEFPVNFILVLLFKKSRRRKPPPNKLEEAVKVALKKAEPNISEAELRRIIRITGDSPKAAVSPVPVTTKDDPFGDAKKKKKKPFSLPWWCRIFAWILLWLAVCACTIFVLFFAISFGDTKTRKWITSLVISFATAIFLTQPAKVLLLAIFFSLVCKKKKDEEEEQDPESDEARLQLAPDEEWMHQMQMDGMVQQRVSVRQPPTSLSLKKAREYRLNEIKMYNVIREIIFYVIFVWALMVVSYGFRDPNSYHMKVSLDAFFTAKPPGPGQIVNNVDFTQLLNQKDFWTWAQTVMAPALRASSWYNGEQAIGQRGFVADRVGRLMGYATLRQLRVLPGECSVVSVMDGIIPQCNDAYSISKQDDSPYGVGWVPFEGNSTVNNSRLEYTYSSWRDLDSYPISGTQALYAGGGYLVELKGNLSDVIDTLQQLQAENWVDGYTRAVIFEFTIYNAQVNLFAVVMYLTEFLPTNGVETWYNIDVVNLLGYYSSAMLLQIACEVIFVVFVAFFIVKEVRSFIKQKRMYFYSIWNWVEMTTIGLSLASIAIYFYRYFETLRLVDLFAETAGNTFINFQYVAIWNELLLSLVGFLVFFSTLKFAKLLRFNKNIGFISSTLKYASSALLAFGFCFFVIFMAFVIFFYLLFSNELTEFMTFISSIEMCFEMLVGKFSFADMVRTSPILGPLFFFIYIIIVFCILINMFVIILNQSFAKVRADISKQSNEYEIIDFMIDSFLKWSGLGSTLQSLGLMKRPEPAAPTEVDETTEAQRLSQNALQHIEQFPGRLDRLLDTVCKMYFNIDHFDDCFPQGGDGKEMMKKLTSDSKQNTAARGKAAMAALGGRQQLPEVEEVLYD